MYANGYTRIAKKNGQDMVSFSNAAFNVSVSVSNNGTTLDFVFDQTTSTTVPATTEEVTASSSQASDMSVENLDNAENAKKQLNQVLEVSHQLDKYM